MKDLIGIYDSGVGGVSVLIKAAEMLPNENFLFFGDNANAPYGPKSTEEICRLSSIAVQHLMSYDIKALVIACNTITSAYAQQLREISPIPVIGMEPAVKPASLVRKNGHILAMATNATLRLDKFNRLMEHYGEGVIPVEGKGLVEIVEAGKSDSDEAREALCAILSPYFNDTIDGIVLGCTHYPFLRRQIEKLFPGVPIFDGREGTVMQLRRKLIENNCLTKQTGRGTITFETSADENVLNLMKTLFKAGL